MPASARSAVTEVVACTCIGLLIGAALELRFHAIDDFIIKAYQIRFAAVNLSNTLTLTLYYDNVDTSQLPDTLRTHSTKTNIIPNVNSKNAYNQGTGGIVPDQPVMHVGAFHLGDENKFLEDLGVSLGVGPVRWARSASEKFWLSKISTLRIRFTAPETMSRACPSTIATRTRSPFMTT